MTLQEALQEIEATLAKHNLSPEDLKRVAFELSEAADNSRLQSIILTIKKTACAHQQAEIAKLEDEFKNNKVNINNNVNPNEPK